MVRDFLGVTLPRLVAPWISGVTWRIDVPPGEKVAYLTYDDGPTAHSTDSLLDLLGRRAASATFFMTGTQWSKHPELVDRVRASGHAIGLHGYAHIDAWKNRRDPVLADFQRCVDLWRTHMGEQPLLYRPPFGHLTPSLQRAVESAGGRVVLWDLLAWDFGHRVNPDEVVRRVTRFIRPGSIVTLHENDAAADITATITLQILDILQDQGWRFRPLDCSVFV